MSYTSKLRARALLGSAATTLVLGALLQTGFASAAFAQNKPAPAGAAAATAEEGTEVEQVVVTGTFLRGTPATAVVPVEGINLEEMRDRGSPSALDFVKGLSEVGSIVGEANRANAYAIGAQTVNLRGLGAARTVVVFNGRRFPETFSFTQGRFNNIAQIPAEAIGNGPGRRGNASDAAFTTTCPRSTSNPGRSRGWKPTHSSARRSSSTRPLGFGYRDTSTFRKTSRSPPRRCSSCTSGAARCSSERIASVASPCIPL